MQTSLHANTFTCHKPNARRDTRSRGPLSSASAGTFLSYRVHSADWTDVSKADGSTALARVATTGDAWVVALHRNRTLVFPGAGLSGGEMHLSLYTVCIRRWAKKDLPLIVSTLVSPFLPLFTIEITGNEWIGWFEVDTCDTCLTFNMVTRNLSNEDWRIN